MRVLKPGTFIIGFALCLTACNVFQQTFDIQPESAQDHLLEGQKFLRQAEYVSALQEFDDAIEADSGLSEAYVGGAKCELLIRHINIFSLMESFQNQDGKSIPFMGEPDSIKDLLYTANRGINKYLGALIRMDSAGRSDGKVRIANISADYALASAIEAVLSLADFNGDGRINSADNILTGIIDFSHPEDLTPEKIMANLEELKTDTVKIQALNDLLDKSQTLLLQSDKAVDLFVNSLLGNKDTLTGACPANQPTCKDVLAGADRETIGDSAVLQVKNFIRDAGSTVVIYKVQDREENDGDGCIDEEYLDGIDNDGDGYTDEDSRGVPDSVSNARFYAHLDGGDNNRDGKIDESAEGEFHRRYLASFQPMELLLHPERKGQIFWKDSVGLAIDSRRKVLVPKDTAASIPVMDTVGTFDLCTGPVTGFKSLNAGAP